MTRPRRLPLVVLLASALAATGLCTSLSAGAAASCPVAEAPEHDACCDQEPGNEACPEAPARPTCRTCDTSVAFLLKNKTGGEAVPPDLNPIYASLAPVQPLAAGRNRAEPSRLLAISASPPVHLLNVTFRN